ncbi:prephenate dehydratase [Jatrophihabitans sp.]|uniref:prephenate dehydratase n=1 Tax=Jatrophihabitans sp. TaxID=1932789 RepID=UPI0030C783BD|nr:prephenate dehydratase [Jatrophihabitans sp.]
MLPRYAYLGPAGTFTEAALRQVAGPDEATYLPQADVVAALDAVRSGDADYAVVAIENSVEGAVTAVLDTLATGEPLVLLREMLVQVSFTLAARGGTELADVGRVAAHPHAWAQCRGWLRENLPGAVHVPSTSNTASASQLAGSDELPFDAALVPPPAVSHYGLQALAHDVADNGGAVTRFVLIGHPGFVPAPTGADKTSLMVHLPDNEAGALLTMLEQFATRGVNLSRIESRPIGDELGRYSFSIDAEGHIAEARMGEALMGLRRVCPVVRFLGSYPRADAAPNEVRLNTSAAAYEDARSWVEKLRSGAAG